MAPGRWLAILFTLSALVSLRQTPYGPAFGFSDHFSHMNAARLFPRVGTALWRTPISQMFAPLDATREPAVPEDVRSQGGLLAVPGWPVDKPLVVGWTKVPRPYPPGDMLLVAPVAILYNFTPLSFAAATHVLILLFLAIAHIAFFLVWQSRPRDGAALYTAAAIVAYLYVDFWTLRGFYDTAAVVPLLLCGRYVAERRWVAVIVSFMTAIFIHFRALLYVPWLLVAAIGAIRARAWATWGARAWIALAAGVLLGGAALYSLMLVMPSLGALPLENPIHPGHVKALPMVAFVVALGVAAAVFRRTGAWLDLTLLVWMAVVLILTRQVQAWHTFLLLPWIFAPSPSTSGRAARIQFVATVTLAVFL
ncbi:MAG: hypothetical protein ACLP1X_19285 [Polyangiaceae bacterium]